MILIKAFVFAHAQRQNIRMVKCHADIYAYNNIISITGFAYDSIQ